MFIVFKMKHTTGHILSGAELQHHHIITSKLLSQWNKRFPSLLLRILKNILGSFLVFFLRIWGWGLIYVILIKKKRCSICVELCLKLWFESDWYFCNISELGWFWKRLSRDKVPNYRFLKSFWKTNCPESYCGTLNSYFHSND